VARVSFTSHLQRHVDAQPREVAGQTVAEVMEQVFAATPAVRGYVLDDQGAVRHHIVIFVDGRPIQDRARLSDPVPPAGEVYVFQALSGG
jgi:molybdopterin synthase sulfur carrier subunit